MYRVLSYNIHLQNSISSAVIFSLYFHYYVAEQENQYKKQLLNLFNY